MSTKWYIVAFVVLVVIVQCDGQCSSPIYPVKYPEDYCLKIQDHEVFDFIVVGSGASGAAVARRLAECPENKVLLLEAGGDPPPLSDIPLNSYVISPEYMWDFHSVNDGVACLGFTDEVCKYFPGKVLGGSTVLNHMKASRGNPNDYEEWKRIGNLGWGYQDVLPYFKKLENFIALPITKKATNSYCQGLDKKVYRTSTVSSKYHSKGGPVTIAKFPEDPRSQFIREPVIEAYKANGIKFNPDINSDYQIGVTDIPGTVDETGYRVNAAKAYLLNIPDNLKVCKYALVHKVNLDTSRNPIKVTSVKFVHSPEKNSTGRLLYAVAMKEYILSGGVFGSPGILERSGIGKPNVLRAAGVKPKHNLCVGENLQDQFGNAGSDFIINYDNAVPRNPLSIAETSLTAFYSFTNPNVPDFQYYIHALTPDVGKLLSFKPELVPYIPPGFDYVVFGGVNLRQGQFGSVHITQSEDPSKTPIIDIKAYTTQFDIDVTVNSTRLARRIMADPGLKRFQIEPLVLNVCKEFDYNSEEEIMCGVRQLTYALQQQSGTCKMGPADCPKSVVDPQLKVIGTENLRVVDASIMPLLPRGPTALPAMMVGEKAADLIKSTWGQLESCKSRVNH